MGNLISNMFVCFYSNLCSGNNFETFKNFSYGDISSDSNKIMFAFIEKLQTDDCFIEDDNHNNNIMQYIYQFTSVCIKHFSIIIHNLTFDEYNTLLTQINILISMFQNIIIHEFEDNNYKPKMSREQYKILLNTLILSNIIYENYRNILNYIEISNNTKNIRTLLNIFIKKYDIYNRLNRTIG